MSSGGVSFKQLVSLAALSIGVICILFSLNSQTAIPSQEITNSPISPTERVPSFESRTVSKEINPLWFYAGVILAVTGGVYAIWKVK